MTQTVNAAPAAGEGRVEVLFIGSQGSAVERLQDRLAKLGYGPIAEKGYGPRTEAAVMKFQATRGLSISGAVGPLTRAELAVLRRGDEGEAVKDLQDKLEKLHRRVPGKGYSTAGEKGFGLRTEGAVRVFQHEQKIAADGVANSRTCALLDLSPDAESFESVLAEEMRIIKTRRTD